MLIKPIYIFYRYYLIFFLKSFNFLFYFFFYKSFFFNVANNFLFLKFFEVKPKNLKNNFFFLKIFKFFNSNVFFSTINFSRNYVSKFVDFKLKNLVFFNSTLFKFYKFFNLFLFNFFYQNYNMLIFDSSYKNNFLFFSNFFNKIDLINFYSFFFPAPNFFLKKNWVFFFRHFCKNFNISLFFINDFSKFKKYINNMLNMDIPVVSILPYNYDNSLFDFSIFFVYKDFYLIKFISLFLINNLFFISLNFRLINLRFYFLSVFYKFFKTLN